MHAATIKAQTFKDPAYNQVRLFCRRGWPDKCPSEDFRPFFQGRTKSVGWMVAAGLSSDRANQEPGDYSGRIAWIASSNLSEEGLGSKLCVVAWPRRREWETCQTVLFMTRLIDILQTKLCCIHGNIYRDFGSVAFGLCRSFLWENVSLYRRCLGLQQMDW